MIRATTVLPRGHWPEGTAIAAPIRLPEVVAALRSSGGGAVLLDEARIAAEVLHLARLGLYVEPTCAQASAAFATLLADGRIGPEETTVVVLTGTGLKATPRIARDGLMAGMTPL